MKSCSYCGRQYPDDATTCAIDGKPLASASQHGPTERGKVSGVWRGAYGYEGKSPLAASVVRFTLTLQQGWLGTHFSGTVIEDAQPGKPGNAGTIDGYLHYPTIEFTKRMPVGYMVRPDGSRITLREYFLGQGHSCENELAGPPISCHGTFLDTNRMQGIWVIKPRCIQLPDGWTFTMPETRGLWCAEFMPKDLTTEPTNFPQQPFFDKSLLPVPDIAAETNAAFRPLGKFPVADAEKYLKRFEQKNIRFEINRDDSAIRQMPPLPAIFGGYAGTAPMIEIFVHYDDEAKAVAIISGDSPV